MCDKGARQVAARLVVMGFSPFTHWRAMRANESGTEEWGSLGMQSSPLSLLPGSATDQADPSPRYGRGRK
jgi:hypothetical protein